MQRRDFEEIWFKMAGRQLVPVLPEAAMSWEEAEDLAMWTRSCQKQTLDGVAVFEQSGSLSGGFNEMEQQMESFDVAKDEHHNVHTHDGLVILITMLARCKERAVVLHVGRGFG